MKKSKFLKIQFKNALITHDPVGGILGIYLKKGKALTREIAPNIWLDLDLKGENVLGLELHGVEKLLDE